MSLLPPAWTANWGMLPGAIGGLLGLVLVVLGRAGKLPEEVDAAWGALSGAFHTLVPIRPRWRGERRSLRTFPAHLSAQGPSRSIPTRLDAFQLNLTPFNSTPTIACMERPSGWSATLLFMTMPVAQLANNFANPSSLEGLSVLSSVLAMTGNALMVPRALFTRDVIWLTGSTWGSCLMGWGVMLSLLLGRDASGARYISPELFSAISIAFFRVHRGGVRRGRVGVVGRGAADGVASSRVEIRESERVTSEYSLARRTRLDDASDLIVIPNTIAAHRNVAV